MGAPPTVRAATAALALLVALGCDESGPTVPKDNAEFAEMRSLWNAQNIEDYDLTLKFGNELTLPQTLRLEIRDDVTVRVSEDASAWRAPTAGERAMTIDSLYARIAVAIADPNVIVITRFDARIGLLTYASANRTGFVDDSYWYEVTNFVRR